VNMEKNSLGLESLHTVLTQELLNRVRSGEATAGDLNVARQFLRDNHIEASPVEDSPLKNLLESLPPPESVESCN